MKRIIHAVVMALLLAPGMLWADDFDAALEAYDAGDIGTAYEIWRPMAEQGDAEAQFRLGHIYRGAPGAPFIWGKQARRDHAESARWYRLAAKQRHADAQMRLGDMYKYGIGVTQDHAEAARWYRSAAEQGFPHAQFNLGVMYEEGQGVAQDYAEAERWYRLAAEQGDANAQFNLGLKYAHGNGVIQDYSTAHVWFNIAARNGHSEAVNIRDALAEALPPEAIAEAQRRARICLESGYQDCE